MAINSARVLVGTPDQLTTGAILNAPIGTELPTAADFDFDTSVWSDSGYISEDGLEIAPDYSTTDIPDWSGANVRRLLEQFTGEITWTHLETSAQSLATTFGEENVEITPATREHGEQVSVAIGATLPERRSWAFKVKDGNNRVLIVVPIGQVTSVDTITFSSSDAIKWPVTLSTYADENGKNLYIYFDDGRVIAVDAPSVTLDQTELALTVGETATLTATVNPEGTPVVWDSANDGVATVNDGVVTAAAAGTATITATITVDGQEYSATCAVTVAEG